MAPDSAGGLDLGSARPAPAINPPSIDRLPLIPNRRDPYNIRTPKPDKPAKAEGKPRKAGKPELQLVKPEARPEQKAQRTKKGGVVARLMRLFGRGKGK